MQANKISSDLDALDLLHQITKWTPNSNQIRPTTETIQAKELFIENLLKFYPSINDYILDIVFNLPFKINTQGQTCVDNHFTSSYKLIENMFPYQLEENTKHYVLWFSTKKKEKTDKEITTCIADEINRLFNKELRFVWYENPKMSIPNLYHVQVFIKIL